MSKHKVKVGSLAPVFLLILQLINNCAAQNIDVKVEIIPASSAAVVSGDLGGLRVGELNFLTDYGGLRDLDKRISEVVDPGANRPMQAMGRGRFKAEPLARSFKYRSDLKPQQNAFAAAHSSWITEKGALLIADDLLPQFSASTRNIRISFIVPPGWAVQTTEARQGQHYTIADLQTAVFFIAPSVRIRNIRLGRSELRLSTTDQWLFSDEDSSDMARAIMSEYRKSFGDLPRGLFQVNLAKFPASHSVGAWEADTRGGTVTIISSDMPFKSQSIQRLHEQLRHELFHLWLPGDLKLNGSYDWFYEGFAMYQSLKTGVKVNQIRFEDMLDTLSRASAIDSTRDKTLSAIDSSKSRWAGGNDQVYARGMLIGFFSDLAMIRASNGKRDSAEMVRELIRRYSGQASDGNEAVTRVMRARPELVSIVDSYVTGRQDFDWQAIVDTGLRAEGSGERVRLVVVPSPSGKQKSVLDRLGYNSWRKLSLTK